MTLKSKLIHSLILFIILSAIATLLFGLIYKFEFTNEYISNITFAVGMISFIFTIGINVGAGNIILPFSYTLKLFFQRKATKEKYAAYSDYLFDKSSHKVNYWHLTIVSCIFLIISLIFNILYFY
jgi:hypothetical protein